MFAALLLTSIAGSPVLADARPDVDGLGPDAQLVGGGGVGLDGSLRNPFIGRVRFGALYVFHPFIANAGASVQVGALGKLGLGVELEFNAWRGLFADVGFARVSDKRWMTHVTLGYTVFGLEWQHDFDDKTPNNALLLEVRFPLGIWWRLIGRREDAPSAPPPTKDPRVLPVPAPPLAVIKPTPPGAAQPSAAPPPPKPVEPAPAERAQITQALAEADAASARGDHAAATAALQRAYMLHADPLLLPRLARAELAQGRLLLATQDLRRFLSSAPSADTHAARADATQLLTDIEHRLAHVRIELSNASSGDQVSIDGVPEPGAGLGYDVAVDPGEHTLVLSRGAQELARRSFKALEGELVRLSVDASKPN